MSEQPELPGAEAVRRTEHPTPVLDAPFSLTTEPSTATRERQPDLFPTALDSQSASTLRRQS